MQRLAYKYLETMKEISLRRIGYWSVLQDRYFQVGLCIFVGSSDAFFRESTKLLCREQNDQSSFVQHRAGFIILYTAP